jgi:hypothetical protein
MITGRLAADRRENPEPRKRGADLAEDDDAIPDPRSRSQNRAAADHLADDRDVENEGARAQDRVPSRELHAVLRAGSLEPVDDSIHLRRTASLRQGGSENDRARPAAHRKYVGDVGSDELLHRLTQRAASPVEVHPLDGRVRREEEIPLSRGENGRIVSDAAVGKCPSEAIDDLEFSHAIPAL